MIAPEATDAPLVISLFGPMQALADGRPLPPMRSRKGLWLLALLTLRHDRPVAREWLTGTLWPDLDQSAAFTNLRPILSELRSGLGSQKARLQSPDRQTLLLNLTGAEVDVLAFDAAIASAGLPELERAVTLYRGPLLEGCMEEWVFQERNVREQRCLQALQTLADFALTAGNYETAIGHYRRAARLDPWQDDVRRGWMEALAKNGDRNAALQVYREFVELLRSDPGAAPDAPTRALYARLRAESRQSASAPAPIAAIVKEPAATPMVAGYLPHPMTDLIGRETERREVSARLRRSRLVTLTGLGGIGKTRLALEVAREVASEYADGAWLVALESLTEGSQAAAQIASVMGLKEEPGSPLLEIVIRHLRPKRLLLVLDNCEHLLEAIAPIAGQLLRECGELRILTTSREALEITGETVWPVPSLAVPDPSRLPKGNDTLPQALMHYESVLLFVERAQAVQKTFALTAGNARAVAQICAHLEGIPLAIELAAARVKAMTAEQIASRLDAELNLLTGGSRTAQSRQQTLRAMLDWSYALLSQEEGALLERLSVFAEGWSLEAAEQAGSASDSEKGKVLDLLASLADKSLVAFEERKTGGRYRLLEMVRQYGAGKLAARGETERVKARHQDYFLRLAEEAAPGLAGSDQGVWLERLEVERANLRAALSWRQTEANGAKAGLQLAGALAKFWEMHGHYSEGRAFLSEALAREGAGGRTKERARALNGAGALSYYQGDYPAAQSLLEESLTIFRELGNGQGVAWALNDLGDLAGAQGRRDTAQTLYEESLAIFRELGDRYGAASLLHHLGNMAGQQGDYGKAQALYAECVAFFRELGNRQNVAWSLHRQANVAGRQGDFVTAWSLQNESLAIFRELGNGQGVAWALNDLGDLAGAQGRRDTAQTLYEESLTIFRELGSRHGAAVLLQNLGGVIQEKGDYDAARTLYEEGLAIFRELGNRQGAGWSLNGLGRVALEQGRVASARTFYTEAIRILEELQDKRGAAESLEGLAAVMQAQALAQEAARLWGAASALRESVGAVLPPGGRDNYERKVELARLALSENSFAAAWEEGRALTWEQAVAFALAEEERESFRAGQ